MVRDYYSLIHDEDSQGYELLEKDVEGDFRICSIEHVFDIGMVEALKVFKTQASASTFVIKYQSPIRRAINFRLTRAEVAGMFAELAEQYKSLESQEPWTIGSDLV